MATWRSNLAMNWHLFEEIKCKSHSCALDDGLPLLHRFMENGLAAKRAKGCVSFFFRLVVAVWPFLPCGGHGQALKSPNDLSLTMPCLNDLLQTLWRKVAKPKSRAYQVTTALDQTCGHNSTKTRQNRTWIKMKQACESDPSEATLEGVLLPQMLGEQHHPQFASEIQFARLPVESLKVTRSMHSYAMAPLQMLFLSRNALWSKSKQVRSIGQNMSKLSLFYQARLLSRELSITLPLAAEADVECAKKLGGKNHEEI